MSNAKGLPDCKDCPYQKACLIDPFRVCSFIGLRLDAKGHPEGYVRSDLVDKTKNNIEKGEQTKDEQGTS